jgi:hypothetical protein
VHLTTRQRYDLQLDIGTVLDTIRRDAEGLGLRKTGGRFYEHRDSLDGMPVTSHISVGATGQRTTVIDIDTTVNATPLELARPLKLRKLLQGVSARIAAAVERNSAQISAMREIPNAPDEQSAAAMVEEFLDGAAAEEDPGPAGALEPVTDPQPPALAGTSIMRGSDEAAEIGHHCRTVDAYARQADDAGLYAAALESCDAIDEAGRRWSARIGTELPPDLDRGSVGVWRGVQELHAGQSGGDGKADLLEQGRQHLLDGMRGVRTGVAALQQIEFQGPGQTL